MVPKAKKAEPKVSLVTGACGFIGSHVVQQLAAAGHKVVATDHPSAWEGGDDVAHGRYPDLVRKLSAEQVAIDLTRPETLSALPARVDYLFHIAGLFSYSAPLEQLRRVNVEGTRALLEYYGGRRRKPQRVVVWGAGGVYGAPSQRRVEAFDEELVPEPGNDYLESKWEEEYLTMNLAPRLGMEYVIVRPTTVYGPRAAYGSAPLFTSALDMAVVAVPLNLRTHIPFIHVVDVARAAIHLAQHPGAANQIYNFNDDTDITTFEFMQAMARLESKPFVPLPPLPLAGIIKGLMPVLRLQFVVARDLLKVKPPLEPDLVAYAAEDFRYDNRKLKATGFEFTYPDARMAFAETLDWYRQNRG